MTALPWRITLDTNPDFCNLSCIMCEDHSPFAKPKENKRPLMSRELMDKVIREAAHLGVKEIIPSTMGEPLLYPYLEDMLNLCRELGLKLNLTTNGTFPSREKRKNVEYWAERIVPIASDVKISWNGASHKIQSEIMPETQIEQHIENARRFITVRNQVADKGGHYCSLTLQLTFMSTNINEIPDMLRLAIGLGFDRIKGHHLWAHFEELKTLSLRYSVESITHWNHTVRICQDIADQHNKTAIKKIRLDNFFELDEVQIDNIAIGGECPFLGREAWIASDGRFNVCCAPNKERQSLGYFGNLNETSLKTIWHSESYQGLTQNYMEYPLCQGCNMRRPVSSI